MCSWKILESEITIGDNMVISLGLFLLLSSEYGKIKMMKLKSTKRRVLEKGVWKIYNQPWLRTKLLKHENKVFIWCWRPLLFFFNLNYVLTASSFILYIILLTKVPFPYSLSSTHPDFTNLISARVHLNQVVFIW